VVTVVGVPIAYFLFRQPSAHASALLLVSTDDSTSKLVVSAAKQAGYPTVHVYRYEDALDKLRLNPLLRMVVVDDSVPQYEVGLLVSALQRMPAGSRPLILIQDSTELGQTAFSHRAEMLVSRPLSEKALETAIRQVAERTTPFF
jgi:CheY-like chemotaxis protein